MAVFLLSRIMIVNVVSKLTVLKQITLGRLDMTLVRPGCFAYTYLCFAHDYRNSIANGL